jgi:phosphoribosyl 1,2-cyclic phosphate phosphodiesterase
MDPSESVRGKLIFLGTGTSVGVPTLGCSCAVCTSQDPRNNRTRCAIVLELPEGNLLVDTPPDLRTQLLREKIPLVHAIAFTHGHADHLFGLDDVRLFPFRLGHAMPLYCEDVVEQQIRKSFDYAFSDLPETHPGATPRLEFCRIDTNAFSVLGARVQPIRLLHGPRFQVLGFRVGNVAYCTDVKEIPSESWQLLQGLDVLILDTLRARPHPTHMNLTESLHAIEKIAPKLAYLTHISHELDHQVTEASLPPSIRLAYDGLRIDLT